MVRGLLVLVASMAGGLVGLQAAPEMWAVLEDLGVVAWPVCNDVFGGTVGAMCARPRSMEVVALATVSLCTAVAGIVVWLTLRVAAAEPAELDATD